MKQGIVGSTSDDRLKALAGEVLRQAQEKRDFRADDRALTLSSNGASLLTIDSLTEEFTVNDIAHGQIATRLGIPKKYYDRLRGEHPEVLDANVNGLWRVSGDRRMVRTLDGKARAYLSDRYRPLDNDDLLGAVLPVLAEAPDLELQSCQVTDQRIYVKAVFPRTQAEVEVGDVVQGGIVISNSEVGLGALSVQPLVYRLLCKNGMISPDFSQRRAHLGRAGSDDVAFEVFRDETIRQDDKALWMKVQDTVRSALSDDTFNVIVGRMREARKDKIADPIKAVEELGKQVALGEGEARSVLTQLIEGGDLSRYGLMNAVTRMSQDVEDYDRATALEATGGKVLALPAGDWNRIAVAA